MSLRVRLLLMIGGALALLWGAVAFWLHADIERQMRGMLDDRLVVAANMVSDLVIQKPELWATATDRAPAIQPILSATGPLACQITSARGEIYGQTFGIKGTLLTEMKPGFATKIVDGQPWRTYTVTARGLVVTIADRMTERATLMNSVVLAAVLPFIAALLGGLLLLWTGVGKALWPLEQLRRDLAIRAIDDLDPVPDAHRPRELHPFVDTLNELLTRIRATVRRERQFTSDAAHELRTPLTAIKVHLQVLRLSHGEDATLALDHADEGVARLQAALEQLLTLSKVEAQADWDGSATARVAEVVQLAVRDCVPGGDARLIMLAPPGHWSIKVPPALAVTALRNLLDNAIRHTPPDGPITLDTTLESGMVCMRVIDNGAGMSDDEMAIATQRFWRRGSGPGSGLGLAIVQAICERFGGMLTLARSSQGGLAVTIALPLASELQEDK